MEKKHEVVISGMSGLFPESDDVDELWENLCNNVDMVTTDGRRWPPGELGVPPGTGKIKSKNEFDSGFFGINKSLSLIMDQITKLSCEQAFRAICDSGMSLQELNGSNTAVFMTSFTSETEDLCIGDAEQKTYGLVAHSRAMQANRISFYLNFKGPSVMLDATFSGGLEALQKAYDLISIGECVAAVVGSSSLLFTPHLSYHYRAMGRLSEDSITRCFSADANGYARSEGCVVFFLQRAAHARRSYGTVDSIRSLYYGTKLEPFPQFSYDSYKRLLEETYANATVKPEDLALVEAIGLASKKVDAEELNAISKVLLPGRKRPLMIGCVKSNLGHTEAASSLVSLAKAILSMDRGSIPPNLHHSSPNPDVPALLSGQLKVVTEVTPFEGEAVGVSSVGVSGPYSHIVVRKNPRDKKCRLAMGELPEDGLPRLVLLTGRHSQNVFESKKRLSEMPIDPEHVDLMNNFARDGIRGHLCRGYTVLNGKPNKFFQTEDFGSGAKKRPIWYVFSGMGSQWPGMGKWLMRLPVFARAIEKCHVTLLPKGLNLIDAVTNDDPKIFDNILNAFTGIAAMQIALVDVLRSVGVEPDGIVGHSLGEQGCGYADGCFTTEQMILSAYARGKASLDANLIKGMMAAVGMGYEQIKSELPNNVEIACHNSKESCTLSGAAEDVAGYIEQLKARGVFAKLVNVGDIAFHSKHMQPAGKLLLKMLGDVIPEPKKRTSRWISSSSPESQWNTPLAQYCSAEYHTNNMLSCVLFQEATSHIPEDAIVIEIAPHALLQAIVKKSLPKATHVPLTNRNEEDSLSFLFAAIGKLYSNGITIEANNLYPHVELPVSRGTPSISPFVGWDHRVNYRFVREKEPIIPLWSELDLCLSNDNYQWLSGHKLGDKFVIPDSFYIDKLIDLYTTYKSLGSSPVLIEKFKFENSCEFFKQSGVKVCFKIQKGGNDFSVTEGEEGKLLCSGVLSFLDVKSVDTKTFAVTLNDDYDNEVDGEILLSLYKYMGLEMSGDFATLKKIYIRGNSVQAVISYKRGLTAFLNSVFLLIGFCEAKGVPELMTMKSAHEMMIDPLAIISANEDIVVEYNAVSKIASGVGIRIQMPLVKRLCLDKFEDEQTRLFQEVPTFVPYVRPNVTSAPLVLEICVQMILENVSEGWDDTVKVYIIGDTYRTDLRALARSPQYGDRLELTFYESEKQLVEMDMSTIHNDVVWVVSMFNLKPSTVKLLESPLKCYVLTPYETPSPSNRIEELSSFQIGNSNISLISIKNSDDDKVYELVSYSASNIQNLQEKLSIAHELNVKEDDDRHRVVLMAVVDSVSSIVHLTDETKQLKHQNLLVYLLTDEPLQSLTPSTIPMKKELKWNVKLGGKWGSVRLLSSEINDDITINDVFTGSQVYPISNVAASKDIFSLGLNLMDVTGSENDNELKVFDYVSSNIMGLGLYDPVSRKFTKDEFLEWPRPKLWTDNEAASVPALYALASYIVHFANNAIKCPSSVLINRGLLPISQAIIALAFHEYEHIYVSVYGDEEKRTLLRMFPGLKEENILDCQTSTFHVDLLRKTKGEGVYKVVNTFSEETMILPCQKCVTLLGVLIQVSTTPISNDSKMGMLFFNKEIIAVAATLDILITSPAETKIRIRDSVQKAIDSGRIEPFNNVLQLPPNSTNNDAAKHLKLVKSKAVVNLRENSNGNSTPKMYVCDPCLSYVIVDGHQKSSFWLQVAEWLLRRGARQINVVLKHPTASPVEAMRIKSLTVSYPSCHINLYSTQRLDSEEGIDKFLAEMDNSGSLSSVILLGSAVKDSAAALDQGLRKRKSRCELIIVGNGGEQLVEKRRKEGLQTVCIRGSQSLLETTGFLQCFDEIIVNSKKNSILTMNRFLLRHDKPSLERPGQEWNHVPTSVSEVHELLRLSSKSVIFTEVSTNTPRWEVNREVDPVFVIPGLRPHRVRMIAKQLHFPMLIAKLPTGPLDIEYVASDLAQQMAALPQNLFTIIADDWGGILGLHIAAKLQVLGRMSTVILLEGNPAWIKRYAAKITNDDLTLMKKYFKLTPKMMLQIRKCKTWEAQMKLIAENTPNNGETSQTLKSVSLIKNRLESVLTIKRPPKKIRTLCHLFISENDSPHAEIELSEYLQKKIVVHGKVADNIEDFVEQSVADINSLVLYEHRDAACPAEENSIGKGPIYDVEFPLPKLHPTVT